MRSKEQFRPSPPPSARRRESAAGLFYSTTRDDEKKIRGSNEQLRGRNQRERERERKREGNSRDFLRIFSVLKSEKGEQHAVLRNRYRMDARVYRRQAGKRERRDLAVGSLLLNSDRPSYFNKTVETREQRGKGGGHRACTFYVHGYDSVHMRARAYIRREPRSLAS